MKIILHLDDNPVFTQLTQATIKPEEYSIKYIPVHKIEDAKNFFYSQLPDLFISDLMIDSDCEANGGIELIKFVHNTFPSVKIMVLSALPDAKIQRALSNYISYYQVKMFQTDELKEKIFMLLKKGRYND